MSLRVDEHEILGHWIFDGVEARADEACKRIEYLTANVLKQVAVSREYGAWETLYRDPKDGRLWERTCPQGHLQGGGPPQLKAISQEEAQAKYEF
jgi:hypothetical protein